MRWALWSQAVILALMAPVVLIVPEILLGRVVAHDARWALAASTLIFAMVSAALPSSSPTARRRGALALGAATLLASVGVLFQGVDVRTVCLCGLFLAGAVVAGQTWRSAGAPAG